MFKASYKIGRVSKGMQISFNLFVNPDDDKNPKNKKLVSKFTYNGNDYLNINPNPYITIDISTWQTKREEGYNPNRSVNLNAYNTFLLASAIKRILKKFETVKSLYYYSSERKLCIDGELASKITELVLASDKKICIKPAVIPSDTDVGVEYEGCVFVINHYYSYTYLTITELEYFYHILSNIRMIDTTLLLINAIATHKDVITENLNKDIEEEVEITDPSGGSIFIKKENPNVIPDI